MGGSRVDAGWVIEKRKGFITIKRRYVQKYDTKLYTMSPKQNVSTFTCTLSSPSCSSSSIVIFQMSLKVNFRPTSHADCQTDHFYQTNQTVRRDKNADCLSATVEQSTQFFILTSVTPQ